LHRCPFLPTAATTPLFCCPPRAPVVRIARHSRTTLPRTPYTSHAHLVRCPVYGLKFCDLHTRPPATYTRTPRAHCRAYNAFLPAFKHLAHLPTPTTTRFSRHLPQPLRTRRATRAHTPPCPNAGSFWTWFGPCAHFRHHPCLAFPTHLPKTPRTRRRLRYRATHAHPITHTTDALLPNALGGYDPHSVGRTLQHCLLSVALLRWLFWT